MAYFDNGKDQPIADEFEQKNQLFTGMLDYFVHEDEIAILNVRRMTGDRVLEKVVVTGKNIEKLIKEKFKPNLEDDFRNIAFLADIEFKNIRIADFKNMEN